MINKSTELQSVSPEEKNKTNVSLEEKEMMVVYQAKKNLIDFSIATDSRYQDTWFHETMAIIFQSVLQKVENGEDARVILTVPPRHGKQISHDTPILTPKGWTIHGKLKVGDCVFNDQGRSTKVLALSLETKTEYIVKFSDGEEIECHGNHEWIVINRRTKKTRLTETKEIFKSKLNIDGVIGKRGCRYRYQVDSNVLINFPKKKLSIHPYFLGVWLGDGKSTSPEFCGDKKDYKIVKKLNNLGYKVTNSWEHKTTKVKHYYYGGMMSGIRKFNLYKNKHIPDLYKFSSLENRLELLAGLIDTDGHKDERDRYRFSTCSVKLMKDVRDLVLSLGSRAYVMECKPVTSSSGMVGKQIVYQIGFNLGHVLPVALSRKQNTGKYIKRNRSIVGIEKTKKPRMGRCVQVEGGVYLVGKTLIPTHNSELATMKFPAWMLGKHPEWPIMVASYSGELAVDFGQGTREIMQSLAYQEIFKTRLRADTKAKGKWMTKERGGYMAAGAGGAITGKGFKIGIVDDIFKNREEAESKIIRDSRWDWYKSTFYTRQEGNTAIIVIGTRWHTDDVIGRLITKQKEDEANNEEEFDKWTLIEFPAIAIKDEEFRKKGDALWTAKFPINKLRKTQNTLGPYEFAALYQCSPITSENQEFKEEWFKERAWAEVEALDTRKFATIDPGGKGIDNDKTGIIRNYVDRQNKWNLKAMGVHFDSKELLEHIFKLHDEGFEKIGIEETVYLKAVEPFYKDACIKRNKFPNIIPIKQPTTQKEVRIRGLIPRYSSGGIYHIENSCKDLEDELIVFPKGAHDDVPDALAMQNEIVESLVDEQKRAIMRAQRDQRAVQVARNHGF